MDLVKYQSLAYNNSVVRFRLTSPQLLSQTIEKTIRLQLYSEFKIRMAIHIYLL